MLWPAYHRSSAFEVASPSRHQQAVKPTKSGSHTASYDASACLCLLLQLQTRGPQTRSSNCENPFSAALLEICSVLSELVLEICQQLPPEDQEKPGGSGAMARPSSLGERTRRRKCKSLSLRMRTQCLVPMAADKPAQAPKSRPPKRTEIATLPQGRKALITAIRTDK